MTAAAGAPPAVAYDAESIAAAVARIAGAIDLAHPAGVVLVPLLPRAGRLALDVARAMTAPTTISGLALTGLCDGPAARIAIDVPDVRHAAVLAIDVVVDTGLTLRFALSHLATKEPRALEAVALVDRPGRRLVGDLPLRAVGFRDAGRFLVGYGLAEDGRWAGLPALHELAA